MAGAKKLYSLSVAILQEEELRSRLRSWRVNAERKPVTLRNPDVGAARDGIAPLREFIKPNFPPKASRFSAGRHLPLHFSTNQDIV